MKEKPTHEELERRVHELTTDNTQLENKLLEARSFTEEIMTYMTEGLVLTDTQETVIFINQRLSEMLGYLPEEITGKCWLDMVPVEQQALAYEAKARRAHGHIDRYEIVLRCKNGQKVPVLIGAGPRFNKQSGQYIGSMAVVNDITERKHSTNQIKSLERRSQALLDHSPVCHKIVDLDFKLQYMSANGFKMLQLDADAPVYGKPYPFDFFPEAFQDEMTKNLKRVISTGEMITMESLTNDFQGNDVWLDSYIIPVFDNVNSIEYLTVVSANVTQRKHDEKEKARLEGQLRQAQKMEAVGQLAGGVAHDFNNMLGVILGYTEMALEEVDSSEPLYTNLHNVHQAAERSSALTNQLLTFARKQTVTPKVIDINDTVQGMLKMLRRLIGEDIKLLWQPGRNLRPVKVDPSQIDQLLANLCVNARDAIAGVGKITIETHAKTFDEAYCADHLEFQPGEYILLEVNDNGCGMDKKTLLQIFEPFFTTKEMGQGTGLGLASVFGMVKQNNGFVNVYSEPDQGTTFKIYLPAYAIQSGGVVEKGPELPTERGNETILLVEDESTILEMTTMMLERLGYTVVAAASPGEAIRLAHEYQGRIDLLMTDVVMPEMNGRELAENLLCHSPDLNRLFMSGYTANIIADHGVLDESVHFIQKPFSMKDLGGKLREALEG